jgi:hypothetical protein
MRQWAEASTEAMLAPNSKEALMAPFRHIPLIS